MRANFIFISLFSICFTQWTANAAGITNSGTTTGSTGGTTPTEVCYDVGLEACIAPVAEEGGELIQPLKVSDDPCGDWPVKPPGYNCRTIENPRDRESCESGACYAITDPVAKDICLRESFRQGIQCSNHCFGKKNYQQCYDACMENGVPPPAPGECNKDSIDKILACVGLSKDEIKCWWDRVHTIPGTNGTCTWSFGDGRLNICIKF